MKVVLYDSSVRHFCFHLTDDETEALNIKPFSREQIA